MHRLFRISCLFLLALTPWVSFGQTPDYSEYAALLKKYVRPDGVKYSAWHQSTDDREKLKAILAEWEIVALPELSENAQKAFFINLYNAAMLDIVLDHYPLQSVATIEENFGIFRQDRIPLAGEKLSLDQIEKGILLQAFSDPRIHFAVNCASESCPPLRAEPFTEAKLEAQLDEQTIAFARSPRAARVNTGEQTIAYSELFQWYDADFAGDNPAEYLNQYREDKLPLSFDVSWIRYDWMLNESILE